MATAQAQVVPIVLQGEDRSQAAFKSLESSLARVKSVAAEMAAGTVRASSATVALGQHQQSAAKSTQLSAFQMQNLGFQINDVVSGLAMGQSPFTIMAQQGGQVYQILSTSPGGVGGALNDLKSRLVGLIGPWGAVSVAIAGASAAALAMYVLIRTEHAKVERALSEHERLVKLVKEAYSGAGNAAGMFLKESRDVVAFQAQLNTATLRPELLKQATQAVVQFSVETAAALARFEGSLLRVDIMRHFASAVDALDASIKKGLPDLITFRMEVGKIGMAAQAAGNTGVALMAKKILNDTAEVAKLAELLKQSESVQRLASGGGTAEDRKRLDISRATISAYQSLVDKTRDRIKEMEIETEATGKGNEELIKAKLAHDLLRAAKQSGIAVDAAKKKSIDDLTAAYAAQTKQLAAAKLLDDVMFERAQMFRSASEQRVFEQLRSAGLDPSSDIGKMIADQIRLNEALKETRDIAKDVLKGFISDLRSGKSAAEALQNALERLADRAIDKLIDLALNSLFGGFAKGGGLFSLFGGGKAMGGPVMPGRLYAVNENTPQTEYFMPHVAGAIVPSGGTRGGGATVINFNYHINAPGADVGTVERMKLAMVEKDRSFKNDVLGVVRNHQIRKTR